MPVYDGVTLTSKFVPIMILGLLHYTFGFPQNGKRLKPASLGFFKIKQVHKETFAQAMHPLANIYIYAEYLLRKPNLESI